MNLSNGMKKLYAQSAELMGNKILKKLANEIKIEFQLHPILQSSRIEGMIG